MKALVFLIAFVALLTGCVPNGYHEVCDEWSTMLQLYYFGGRTPTFIPQTYCAVSHLEKDRAGH